MTQPPVITAAFVSTSLISVAPNVLLYLFPNYAASNPSVPGENIGARAFLSLGQALAVGGLLGDVFLHTLPDCFGESTGHHVHNGQNEEHSHHSFGDVHEEIHHDHHDHQHTHHVGGEIGMRVLVGFLVFFILDILVRSLEDSNDKRQCHSHSQSDSNKNGIKLKNGAKNESYCGVDDHRGKQNIGDEVRDMRGKYFSSIVFLNLLGDALHNFTDGLAIGATFAASSIPQSPTIHSSLLPSAFSLLKSKGGLVSLTVFLHELPHELGDFATLVNAGFSRNDAIKAQFITAIGAFLGTALGLFSGQIVEGLGHDILLPFTAGGFLYLCATILPEILEARVSAQMRLLQVCSFMIGVSFMYAVAELEEADERMKNIVAYKSNGHLQSEL